MNSPFYSTLYSDNDDLSLSDSCDDWSDDEDYDYEDDVGCNPQHVGVVAYDNLLVQVPASDESLLSLKHIADLSVNRIALNDAFLHKQSGDASEATTKRVREDIQTPVKPVDHLKSILQKQGIHVPTCPYGSMKSFFEKMSDINISAYEKDVVAAFRREDLAAIKDFHKQGKLLQCCNKFYESVVHLACRRGSYEILHFLTTEANVSVRLVCDSGRNPLHDACWTSRPSFELVRYLLTLCPDFLYISDNRGFTPLEYIPKDQWSAWCAFFDEHKDLVAPREITPIMCCASMEPPAAKKRKFARAA